MRPHNCNFLGLKHLVPGVFKSVCLALSVALLGSSSAWAARLSPEAPIEDFLLPFFNASGQREWELSGQRGIYLSEAAFQIEGMLLKLYSTQPDGTATVTRILSPLALVEPEQRQASGPEYLYVTQTGDAFSIAGRDWQWSSPQRKLTVREDVRVVFRQQLGAVLTFEP
jgi:hypothetical protein